MRLAYRNTEILVLNDSGPAIQNPEDLQAIADREANWHISQFLPPTCPLCFGQPIFLTDWAMKRDPTLRGAFFGTLRDFVVRGYLSLTPGQYQALLLDITGRVQRRQPDRFKRFLVDNEFHTILFGVSIAPGERLGPAYRNLHIGDTRLSKWVYDFVNDGAAWQDVQEPAQP
jgi:hypothetical protein